MSRIEYKDWAVTSTGDVVGGSAVEVRVQSTGALADLYDAAAAGSLLSNPLTAEADGSFVFFVEPGKYDVTVGSGASESTKPLYLTDYVTSYINVSGLESDARGYDFFVDGDVVDVPPHRYEVDSAATYGFVTNGAGVKLRVLPGADGQFDVGAWGKNFREAGNIDAVSDYLKARQSVLPKPLITRDVPKPKLNLISPVANGKNFQGFPSAVRHDGSDFILYREGLGHTESTPFGSKARLVCAVRPVDGITPTSTTEIFAETDVDPRDPNVLRDDYGNAILVGGVFKVVIFEWAGSYDESAASAKVYDLDPDDLAAGLVNPVTIPSPVKAVKSDVRQLGSGGYAFVGYSISGTCYLVTTSDWLTFATEEIGQGNEAAFVETYDGALNVIARAEESFGAQTTIFYKKQPSGAWYVHDVLPYTLNAPTLVKSQGVTTVSHPDANEGWLLFARDKTGRLSLGNNDQPTSELVCLRSKQDRGQEIINFIDRKVVCGTPIQILSGSGDAHYCSVISGGLGSDIEIYTYSEFNTIPDQPASSCRVKVWRIQAVVDTDEGIQSVMPDGRNYLANGSFEQGASGLDITHANMSLVVDPDTGRDILRLTDGFVPTASQIYFNCKKGETLFIKARVRLNYTSLANGNHFRFNLYDNEGAPTAIQTEQIQLPPDIYQGKYHTIVTRPFIATSDRMSIRLTSTPGSPVAQSDIAALEVSDAYGDEIRLAPRLEPVIKVVTLNFPVTSGVGTQAGGGTYTSNIWGAFGLQKRSDGLPIPAVSASDIAMSLTNCTMSSGTVRVLCTATIVNSDGSVTARFAIAPGETGTMQTTVSVLATAIIQTNG